MRNRTVPLTALLILLVFAWLAHKPSQPAPPAAGEGSNEARVDREGRRTPDRAPDREGRRTRDGEDRNDSPNSSRQEGSRQDPSGNGDGESSRGRERRNRPASAAPGTFDFYLLNLSWSPEFCVTHPSAAECATHVGFILHGLWPQNTDGTYPEHCSDVPPPGDLDTFKDITPDTGLLRHEWTTHGTCSGLSPDAFFTLARRAFHSVAIPRDLAGLTSETSNTPAEVLTDFARANPSIPASSLALSCGNNRLTAIEVCLDKTLHPIACSDIRSCRANSIRITPP